MENEEEVLEKEEVFFENEGDGNQLLIDSENDVEHIVDEEFDTLDEMVPLNLGTELSLSDIYAISSAEASKLIVFAGSHGCGKTTLLTALYQQFLTEPMQKYYFAGSNTLQAFEDRAFYTRVQSLQSSPNMKRTVTGSIDSFLHLRLLDSETKSIKNFFISDFAGEDFNRVIGNPDLAIEEFTVISKANILFLILDGENISVARSREKELHRATQLLRTLVDSDILHHRTRVIVVISKYDLVIEALHTDESLNTFIESILDKFAKFPTFKRTSFEIYKVAAMPERMTSALKIYDTSKIAEILFEEKTPNKYNHEYQPKSKSQFHIFGRGCIYE